MALSVSTHAPCPYTIIKGLSHEILALWRRVRALQREKGKVKELLCQGPLDHYTTLCSVSHMTVLQQHVCIYLIGGVYIKLDCKNATLVWLLSSHKGLTKFIKISHAVFCLKAGTQDWDFFWLRFWNLYYFFISYVKLLRFYQKNFLIRPLLGEIRFFRLVWD